MPERKAKWQNDYISRTYDRINLTVPKGSKAILQAHAESMGESVNGFINRAINETIKRDGQGESAPQRPAPAAQAQPQAEPPAPQAPPESAPQATPATDVPTVPALSSRRLSRRFLK